MSTPRWLIECDYMESCNCDFGCTCNFIRIPTRGPCEALVGYHVRKGNFGNVSLDGEHTACSLRRVTPTGMAGFRTVIARE